MRRRSMIRRKAAHIAAYQEQFNRVTLDLGETSRG